jgi:hypothetical protein
LGSDALAPKLATFDLAAMKAVWQVEEPDPIMWTVAERRLLVAYTKLLLTED